MPNQLVELQSVCIICESVLKNRVLKQIVDFGATGYTWCVVQGHGEHDTEANIFTGPALVKVEVWCPFDLAERILAYCQSKPFRDLGMSAAMSTIRVHPDEAAKYGAN